MMQIRARPEDREAVARTPRAGGQGQQLRRYPGRERFHRCRNGTALSMATRKAIESGTEVALWTMDQGGKSGVHARQLVAQAGLARRTRWRHLGLAALAVELPVSATIMLRSIADIARSGRNLKLADVRLECVQVLALGGRHRTTMVRKWAASLPACDGQCSVRAASTWPRKTQPARRPDRPSCA